MTTPKTPATPAQPRTPAQPAKPASPGQGITSSARAKLYANRLKEGKDPNLQRSQQRNPRVPRR